MPGLEQVQRHHAADVAGPAGHEQPHVPSLIRRALVRPGCPGKGDRTLTRVRGTWVDALLVLVFVLLGGCFAAAEIALVSLRESQVRSLQRTGAPGRAAGPAGRPTPTGSWPRCRSASRWPASSRPRSARRRWPSRSAGLLRRWGMPAGLPDTVAFIGVTIVISYVSLVFGELAPKRLGAAAGRGGGAGSRPPPLDRIATAGPAGDLAAVAVHQRRGPAARRRPEGQPRGDHRGGAARPGRRARVAAARRSASSSTTCSRPATGRCAR